MKNFSFEQLSSLILFAIVAVVKVRVARGLAPLLRFPPHLLNYEPGLLVAATIMTFFFVSELVALVTVLKSHYYEA